MSKPSVSAYAKSNVPASPKSAGATVTSISGAVPVQHQIRQRAHQLFESRGREDGKAEQDWLSAEREILNKRRQ
jgi:hypothetical protein